MVIRLSHNVAVVALGLLFVDIWLANDINVTPELINHQEHLGNAGEAVSINSMDHFRPLNYFLLEELSNCLRLDPDLLTA